MLYRRVDCPHCGNEIKVNDMKSTKKCHWCKRFSSVKFVGIGKKANAIVEAIDSSQIYGTQEKSYSSWKDEDIYGY